MTTPRQAATALVAELETAYATQWPERSARQIVDRLEELGVTAYFVRELAARIEAHQQRLPTPAYVVQTAREMMRESRRYPTVRPLEAGEVARSYLEDLYPGEKLAGLGTKHIRHLHAEQYTAATCTASRCDVHPRPEPAEATS